MEIGAITDYIDVAQLALYAFWVFFAGLVFYLQRESRREGYPLVSEDGVEENHGLWMDETKTYELMHGDHKFVKTNTGERREIPMIRQSRANGDPYIPTGDPMIDGVGVASYAMRHDQPDFTFEGEAKIVPLRAAPEFYTAAEDDDPRGMTVYGCDGAIAGTCSDIWIDKSEYVARYLEVDLGENGKMLLPYTAADIQGPRGIFYLLLGLEVKNQGIFVDSIRADQFKACPRTAHPEQVTLLEEDKIMGYVGGGKLYATPARSEPLI